jgi:hypothetical protein
MILAATETIVVNRSYNAFMKLSLIPKENSSFLISKNNSYGMAWPILIPTHIRHTHTH